MQIALQGGFCKILFSSLFSCPPHPPLFQIARRKNCCYHKGMNTSSRIKAFDMFTQAVIRLENKDKELFSWPRNRITLTHALAVHLHDLLENPTYSVDLYHATTKSKYTANADILVHNRTTGHRILSIVCRNDYLTEHEQKALSSLITNAPKESGKPNLVLAISFMPQKRYMLIYIANEDGVEYYHFDRNLMIMEPVRKRIIEEKTYDEQQPSLVKLSKSSSRKSSKR